MGTAVAPARGIPAIDVSRLLIVVAWAAIVLGALLRFTQLDSRLPVGDEIITQYRVAGHTTAEIQKRFSDGRSRAVASVHRETAEVTPDSSPAKLLRSITEEDVQHPPLFYLVEFAAVRAFGNDLAVWRFVPALFGLLSIGAAYALARALFPQRSVALVAAALFAVSPLERIYSEQAREFSLLTLMTLLTTFAVVRAAAVRSARWWALYAVLLALGLYASPFIAYVMIAHAVFVGATAARARAVLFGYVAASLAAIAAYGPWIVELIVRRGSVASTTEWAATRWPLVKLAAKWVFNTGATFFDLEYHAETLYLVAFAVTAVVASLAIVRGFRSSGRAARWCLGAAIFIPAALFVVPDLMFGQHYSSVARYLLPVYAMLPIVAARGLFGRPLLTAALLVAAAWSSAAGAASPVWWDNDGSGDDLQMAAVLGAQPRVQIVSSMWVYELDTIATRLRPDARVTFSYHLDRAELLTDGPIFVMHPTARDLAALQRREFRLEPVPIAHALTARELGDRIAATNTRGSRAAASPLYRAYPRSGD